MVKASKLSADELPTPYQLGLLVGISTASIERLRQWTSHHCFRQQRRNAPRSPEMLSQAGRMLCLCFIMATLMFAADAIIHYTTRTVEYDQVKESSSFHEYGRGLSQQCLTLNRGANYGFPCSLNSLIPENDYLRQHNEMLYLLLNNSQTSEIHVVPTDVDNISLLLPKTLDLSPHIDYRASTIGITTRCKPITNLCRFGRWGLGDMYSGFYCSSEFWGTLGETANGTSNQDVPPLAFKASPNLM